jgi:pimeloyl-ACP methyl ester carboxylesterase
MSATGRAWLDDEVPDQSRLLSMPFGRVYASDVGPGPNALRVPPLVLLHGVFVTHYAFHRIVPALARHRRVIALDLPGCGDSDRPPAEVVEDYGLEWLAQAVLHSLGALDVPDFDVYGHDFGGAVAMVLAAEHPERVRRVVLADPLALSVSLPFSGPLGVVPALGLEVFRRTLRKADVKGFLEQGLSTPELLSFSELNVYWDRIGRRGGREATFAMLSQVANLVRLRDRFSRITAPTLVLWGDRDVLVPPEQGERLAELLPHASLELIEGCGHNPAIERPEQVVCRVEAHCRPESAA